MDFAMDELEIYRAEEPNGATWQLRDIMSYKRARKYQDVYRIRPVAGVQEAKPKVDLRTKEGRALRAAQEGDDALV